MESKGTSTVDTMLVASTGGHLDELLRMRRHLASAREVVHWVTFDEPQSRAHLADERVTFVQRIEPRALGAALAVSPAALALMHKLRPRRVISTGSAIAVPFLAAARTHGIESHYIESAARTAQPSLTGKLVSAIPGVHLHTQYPRCATARWHYGGSLFDGYQAVQLERKLSPRRVVVTLGTMRDFSFRRAVLGIHETLQELAPGAEVLWQTGPTPIRDLGIDGRDLVPAAELTRAVASADLVIAHAGVGSALTALDAGKVPVLLPRQSAFHEHVDDHQLLIADALAQRNLAVPVDPAGLTPAHCLKAMRWRVSPRPDTWTFRLGKAA